MLGSLITNHVYVPVLLHATITGRIYILGFNIREPALSFQATIDVN